MTLPGPFRQVRVRPAWGAVVGLALVGLAAALVMGVRAWTATASAVPTPVSPTGARSAAPAASGTAASSGAGTASRATATGGTATAAPTTLVVHVVGRVVSPGVVRLPGGSRVEDAVKAAGGASSGAELTSLNLARTLVDGEQIIVPAPGEAASAAPGPTSSGAARGTPSGGKPAGQPIDLNSADAAALDSLPGVGPVTAQKILDWRAAHGRFSSVDELAEVPGIGPKLLEQITPLVRV